MSSHISFKKSIYELFKKFNDIKKSHLKSEFRVLILLKIRKVQQEQLVQGQQPVAAQGGRGRETASRPARTCWTSTWI